MVYKASLLLLLWAGVTASAVVELDKRIYNGQPCHRPYHVKLLNHVNGIAICGGSLISSQWVLTAAHCMDRTLLAIADQVSAHVRLAHDPQFIRHDLMLLNLSAPITGITPVAPPDCKKKPKIGVKVEVAGHGATCADKDDKKKYEFKDQLHCGNMNVVDCGALIAAWRQTCPRSYNAYRNQHWLCYEAPGVDTCPGDSGGGVVYNNMIYGVHVFGDAYVCRSPSGFMDLCHPEYAAWITETTGIKWPA